MTTRFFSYLPVLLATVLLTGCFNGYTRGYRSYVATGPMGETPNVDVYSGYTELHQTESPDEDAKKLVRQGYVLLGESAFNDESGPIAANMREHAQKIGADIVLYSDMHLGTEQRMLRQEIPHPDNVQTATITEVVGGVPQTRTLTLNTPVPPEIVYTPYTVEHYSHWASFWRKGIQPTFGAVYTELDEQSRRTLERNTGVKVINVIDNSPAFDADVLVDDVIIAVSGHQIRSCADMDADLKFYAGMSVQLDILRKGQPKTLFVTFNNQPLPSVQNAPTTSAQQTEKSKTIGSDGIHHR